MADDPTAQRAGHDIGDAWLPGMRRCCGRAVAAWVAVATRAVVADGRRPAARAVAPTSSSTAACRTRVAGRSAVAGVRTTARRGRAARLYRRWFVARLAVEPTRPGIRVVAATPGVRRATTTAVRCSSGARGRDAGVLASLTERVADAIRRHGSRGTRWSHVQDPKSTAVHRASLFARARVEQQLRSIGFKTTIASATRAELMRRDRPPRRPAGAVAATLASSSSGRLGQGEAETLRHGPAAGGHRQSRIGPRLASSRSPTPIGMRCADTIRLNAARGREFSRARRHEGPWTRSQVVGHHLPTKRPT